MADSFNKKERDKKKRKKKQDKLDKKRQNKIDGVKQAEFLYMDEDGNLSPVPPDPTKKKKIKLSDIEISVPKKTEESQSIKIRNGYVKFYDQEKRFGFIREENSRDDFFFHADSLSEPVKENDKVTYEMGSGPKGPVAIEVKLRKEPKKEVPAPEEKAEEPAAEKTEETTDNA